MNAFLAIGSSIAFLALLAPPTSAQDLKVGDKAPSLNIAKWVKGDAVESFAPGKVYVVEFWATWCGPCIASMPHLSELQKEFAQKGVTIVGVTSEDPNNSLADVEAMVADKGDGMGYTVAWDEGRSTNEAFMKAAGQRGIPCSFVVDGTGTLAYIGHPMFLDMPLGEIVAGTWDPVKGKDRIDAARRRLSSLAKEVAEDTDESNAKIDEFLAEFPALRPQVDNMRFHIRLKKGDFEGAYSTAANLVEAAVNKKDASGLNEIAWAIVDPEAKIEKRDLALAMKAAEKAVEFSKAKDGAILDTLARVWFWKKDYAKAVELQTKAVSVSKRDDLKAALDEYRKLLDKAGEDDGQ